MPARTDCERIGTDGAGRQPAASRLDTGTERCDRRRHRARQAQAVPEETQAEGRRWRPGRGLRARCVTHDRRPGCRSERRRCAPAREREREDCIRRQPKAVAQAPPSQPGGTARRCQPSGCQSSGCQSDGCWPDKCRPNGCQFGRRADVRRVGGPSRTVRAPAQRGTGRQGRDPVQGTAGGTGCGRCGGVARRAGVRAFGRPGNWAIRAW